MSGHRAQVEELLAGYRRGRERLAAVQRELASISASATDARGVVTVTVGPRGTLTALTLTEDSYGAYSPSELAAEIVRLAASAARTAFAGAGEVLAPALPAGSDPQALVFGTADLDASEIAPPEPVSPASDEASYDEQNWIEDVR